MTWPSPDCQARIAAWLAREVRDAATVEDLIQETSLQTVLVAAREGATDAGTVDKLAWGVARNMLARERRRGRKGLTNLTNLEGELGSRRALELPEDLVAATREHLLAIRPALEAELSKGQRAVLALYLDEGITSIRGLARRLDIEPRNVRRRLDGIARAVMRLS